MVTSRILALLLPLMAAGSFINAPVHAASLSGSWAGSGTMHLNSGGKERVRCRVKYFKQSATQFSMSARCASGAGRLDQTGSLIRTSANIYQGTVYNQQHGISASIYVKLKGRRQSVSINSVGGSASLSLRKR